MKTYSFNTEERLKSRKLIETLFREGKAFSVFPYRVLFMRVDHPGSKYPAQAGFTVSTKRFPHAVDRNRVKRLTRECWRLQKQPFYDYLAEHSCQLAVFFIYTDKKIAPYSLLQEKVSVILKKLEKEVLKLAMPDNPAL
ncbi:ribonuclease P protein component [Chitinophaga sp. YR573]|uniref:ribonuclease P protein component n=1 Tax=Chitinophaga sp. YR573 TaxID=1881040 RepID=UPI0008D7E4AA|nr:ribonuclease P protein component [Chitinophaga sp. YR573]SEW14155.1 ribonuclease P protein component [Chitinophaga sp. YR573]